MRAHQNSCIATIQVIQSHYLHFQCWLEKLELSQCSPLGRTWGHSSWTECRRGWSVLVLSYKGWDKLSKSLQSLVREMPSYKMIGQEDRWKKQSWNYYHQEDCIKIQDWWMSCITHWIKVRINWFIIFRIKLKIFLDYCFSRKHVESCDLCYELEKEDCILGEWQTD